MPGLRGAALPECELRVHGAGVRDARGHGRRGLEPGEGDGVDVRTEEEEEQAGEQDVPQALPLHRRGQLGGGGDRDDCARHF